MLIGKNVSLFKTTLERIATTFAYAHVSWEIRILFILNPKHVEFSLNMSCDKRDFLFSIRFLKTHLALLDLSFVSFTFHWLGPKRDCRVT